MALMTTMTQPAIPVQPTPLQQANPFGQTGGFLPQASTYGQNFQDPNAMVQDSIQAMLNPNSSYIKNARQRGVEYAASRGGLNSSIAAGASERSAMEAAAPLAQQALAISGSRETAQANDWQNQQQFNRDFVGQLTMAPIQNSYQMLSMLQQQALADPELYTPEVISGYSNFFTSNMSDIMKRFGTTP